MFFSNELRRQWEKAAPNNSYIVAKLMENEDICIGVLETFLQAKINRIKANREMEMGYMTQRVYENDLKTIGYMDGYDSALEYAESKYSPILEEKDAQLAEMSDEITQLKAMLKEALTQLNQK